ncbi:MAG TPA: hypothetical protein VGV13_01125 [Methylomirabilota bacterium]|jgi:hypothetical protein|nr:hypothetical protein [Methylomirabilota bacterium]
MRIAGLLIGLGLSLVLSGCAEPEREWMKVNQPYTVEEFRRDIKECTRKGALDEDCMKGRGWVSVAPPKSEKAPEPTMRQPNPRGRY